MRNPTLWESKIAGHEQKRSEEEVESGHPQSRTKEVTIEDKRRRLGRFIGLRDCQSPGVEDECLMEQAIEAWISGEMNRRMRYEEECEMRVGKMGW